MTYDEILANARGNMGYCHVCPVCNGLACKNNIPGPGSKGTGTVSFRNYDAWQHIYLNMDTIAEDRGLDTTFRLFGQEYSMPVFAAPIGAVTNHYGNLLDEITFDTAMAQGCRDAGIAAFTGDGLSDALFAAGCSALASSGFAIPTVKPWHRDLVFRKIDQARAAGATVMAMDIDASGLPFLKKMTPPSGSKSVAELREIIDYAGMPFILKGIMTPAGAEKAIQAGASAIVVSNHGGRVLDHVPATATVLPAIADAVQGRIPILVDGGIRTGYDIFKALALGASGVLIARPFVTMVYGGGSAGVGVYLDKLRGELTDAMQMCGCATLADINRSGVCHG